MDGRHTAHTSIAHPITIISWHLIIMPNATTCHHAHHQQSNRAHRLRRASPLLPHALHAGHGAARLSSKRQARSGWPLRLPSAPSREGTEPTAQPPRRIMGKVRRAQPPDKVCGRAMTRGDHITAPNCGCQSATRAAALRRRHEVMRWRTASWAVRIGSASVSTTFARPAPRGRDFAILPSQRAPHRALLPRLCWASTSPCA